MALETTNLCPALGAIIRDINLGSCDLPLAASLQHALVEHKLLVFPDQYLTPQQLVHAATLFGTPAPYPFVAGLKEAPLVVPIQKEPEDKANFGGVWHSDTPYLEKPAAGALLQAQVIPRQGGDTLFSNAELAWQALPGDVQQTLIHLKGVHYSDKPGIVATRQHSTDTPTAGLKASHPAVRRHPVSGHPSLYVSEAHTQHFEGQSEADSHALLQMLFNHIKQEAFCTRIQWQPGMLIVWDNQSTQHFPLNDYPGERRLMHRISLDGTEPLTYQPR